MDKELKKKLKENLFFLKGVEEDIADSFLDGLPEPECFHKGEVICSPCTQSRGLGLLISGRLEIEAGQNTVSMRQMEAPDVFGAAALFGGGEYVSTMRASSRAEVVYVSQEKLTQLMQSSFTVAQNYIDFLSEKVRFLNLRIENFTAGSASAALWDYLVRRADEGGELPAPVNMSRLAKALNMGRTSLYRAVEELEEGDRLIRKEDKWIINNNPQRRETK